MSFRKTAVFAVLRWFTSISRLEAGGLSRHFFPRNGKFLPGIEKNEKSQNHSRKAGKSDC
jgi:hypothetical protein